MARLPFAAMGIFLILNCGVLAKATPQTGKQSQNSVQRAVQDFTEAWLLARDMNRAMHYVSPRVEKSPCLIEQAREEKQSGATINARAFLERYLTEWRDTHLGKRLDGLSREKSESLAEIIEPLPLANRDVGSEVLPNSGQSTLLQPSEKAIRSLACNEKDSSWLKRLAEGSRLVVQAFHIKGTAEGNTFPMILFWKQEKNGWRVVAVGTIQD